MAFSDAQIKQLSANLDVKHVRERKGPKGSTLSYIEGWHAIAEANRIFGSDRWERETSVRCVSKDFDGKQHSVSYMAKVKITVDHDIKREGVGFGHGKDFDPGKAHESAAKEAETDATKRALMTFGWPFGLALYDKGWNYVSEGDDNV